MDRLGKLIGSVRQIEKLVRSKKGIETCWGRMGVFRHRMDYCSRASRRKPSRKTFVEALDYVEYKRSVWNKHCKEQEEGDGIYKLYDRN